MNFAVAHFNHFMFRLSFLSVISSFSFSVKKRPKPKAKFLQKNIRSIFKIHKIMKSVVKLEEKGRRNSGGDRPYKRLKFRTYKKK